MNVRRTCQLLHYHQWCPSMTTSIHISHSFLVTDCVNSKPLINSISYDKLSTEKPLQWRHNERNGVSTRRRLDCLLNRLFRRRSKKASKLRVTGLCMGNHRWPVDSHHRRPVIRKRFPRRHAISNALQVTSSYCIISQYIDYILMLIYKIAHKGIIDNIPTLQH